MFRNAHPCQGKLSYVVQCVRLTATQFLFSLRAIESLDNKSSPVVACNLVSVLEARFIINNGWPMRSILLPQQLHGFPAGSVELLPVRGEQRLTFFAAPIRVPVRVSG